MYKNTRETHKDTYINIDNKHRKERWKIAFEV